MRTSAKHQIILTRAAQAPFPQIAEKTLHIRDAERLAGGPCVNAHMRRFAARSGASPADRAAGDEAGEQAIRGNVSSPRRRAALLFASSSWDMRILVTGASGFVGSALLTRLAREGHDLRAIARDPSRVTASKAHVTRGDVLTGEGLAQALDGVDVAYYLIHSMERQRPLARVDGTELDGTTLERFAARERLGAERFADAAVTAGVERIVYLGGLLPKGAKMSRHLASRAAVERVLLEAVPSSLALRASIVIGARSRSFRLLVRLLERMPILTLPSWRDYRTQPIDERDVIEMLAVAASAPSVAGLSLDLGGPDVVSYGEMLERIAEIMLLDRPTIGLRLSVTPIAARLAAAIAKEDPELVMPLMESLEGDLLPADDRAARLLDVPLHSFDAAVEHALGRWERVEPLAAR